MSAPTPAEAAGKELFDELVNAAFAVLEDGEVTFGEVVQLGGLLASKVNRIAGLSGPAKKELVVSVVQVALKRVVSEVAAGLSGDEKVAFEKRVQLAGEFARETLPDVIDVAVKAARGELDLGKAKKTCWSLVRLAFQCAGKPAPVLPKVLEPVIVYSPKENETVPVSEPAAPAPAPALPPSPKPEEKDMQSPPPPVEEVPSVSEPEPESKPDAQPMATIQEDSREVGEESQPSPQKEEESL